MATTWAFEEDFIVCDFYLRHPDDWQQHLDEAQDLLKERGFSRDKQKIAARIQNYKFMRTGKGLANGAAQSKRIYGVLSRNASAPAAQSGVQVYIRENYAKDSTSSASASFDEEQDLSPLDWSFLSATQQTLHRMVFTLPKEPTFREILFGLIDKHGFKKDSDVYNACQVKRDTFSAIRCGKNNGVSRRTVMQLCFGARLTYDEAVVLMASAGYAFSNNNLTDVIVAYYLKQQIYDIFEVNISLYDSGADLLF